jgi:hypothetical protein
VRELPRPVLRKTAGRARQRVIIGALLVIIGARVMATVLSRSDHAAEEMSAHARSEMISVNGIPPPQRGVADEASRMPPATVAGRQRAAPRPGPTRNERVARDPGPAAAGEVAPGKLRMLYQTE